MTECMTHLPLLISSKAHRCCSVTEHALSRQAYKHPLCWSCVQVTFDRQHICTAEGRHVRVFDAGSFDQLNVYQVPHMAESASYCHSRRRFVAGGEDLWVYLYDADTGQVRRRIFITRWACSCVYIYIIDGQLNQPAPSP